MCRPPSEQSVRAVLGTVSPDVTIERIQAIPSPRLQRLYEVTTSDNRIIHLVMSPSTRLRLLRSEHFMIPAEALAVRWVRNELSKDPEEKEDDRHSKASSSVARTGLGLLQLVPNLIHLSPGINELGSACSFFESAQGTPIALVPGLLSPEERQEVDGQVGRMFRELAHLTSPTGRFGPAATCLSTSSPNSSPRRKTGGGIIRAGTGSSSSSSLASAMAGSNEGVDTWSGAFHLMLEGILRDGEDMAVMISYSAIRRHFKRLRHLLDLVTVPRLVVIDGADESNVLVSSLPPPSPPPPTSSPPTTTTTTTTTSAPRSTLIPISSIITQATSNIQLDAEKPGLEPGRKEAGAVGAGAGASTFGKDQKPKGNSSNEKKHEEEGDTGKEDNGSMAFAGLRDWSTSFFGDPLIATVFSDGGPPSSSFLKGFNHNDIISTTEPTNSSSSSLPPPTTTAAATVAVPVPLPLNETLIEHPETAHIRQLLYQVYHASVSIVKEFYRPRGGNESSRRELEGRKKLTEALARLEQVQDQDVEIGKLLAANTKRRYGIARLSGEMSPAKRVKEGAAAHGEGE